MVKVVAHQAWWETELLYLTLRRYFWMPMFDIKQNIHMIWPKYGTRMRRVSAYVIKLLALLTDIPMRGNEEDSSSSIFSNHIPL